MVENQTLGGPHEAAGVPGLRAAYFDALRIRDLNKQRIDQASPKRTHPLEVALDTTQLDRLNKILIRQGQASARYATEFTYHPAILSFEEQRHRHMTLAEASRVLFETQKAWCIQTVWDQPEIWVPYVFPQGRAANCSSEWNQIGQLGEVTNSFHCDRPGGHGGRHASYGQLDHTLKLFRVHAVWPQEWV